MPYCSNCGSKVTNEMLFCPQCGNRQAAARVGVSEAQGHDSGAEVETKQLQAAPSPGIRKGKLYKQWVEHAGLPPEEVQSRRKRRDIPFREETNRPYPLVLYVLLGAIILILCAGMVFLFMQLRH